MLQRTIAIVCLLAALCVLSGCAGSNKSSDSSQSSADRHHDMSDSY